jgi:ADP-ribose pyrophosphatase YjhB (NUDIX family)
MPDIGVTVVVMRDDHVLLTRREDFDVWCLPGGSVDPNESVAQAAVREVREETGIDVRLAGMVGVCSRPFWTPKGEHNLIFAAEPLSHTLVPQLGEVTAVGYFPIDQLPQPLVSLPHHLTYIQAAFARAWGQVWTLPVRVPDIFLDRAALYRWRDELGVSRAEAYERLLELVGPCELHNVFDSPALYNFRNTGPEPS